jgi:hypothetical protein
MYLAIHAAAAAAAAAARPPSLPPPAPAPPSIQFICSVHDKVVMKYSILSFLTNRWYFVMTTLSNGSDWKTCWWFYKHKFSSKMFCGNISCM